MTDQQRADTLDPSTWCRTPNIDALRRRGVVFDQCTTNAPVCIPARHALATGLYPHNSGIWMNVAAALGAAEMPWTRSIKSAGYSTGLFGKTHLHHFDDLRAGEALFRSCGFDVIDEAPGPYVALTSRSNLTDAWREAGVLEDYQADLARRAGPAGVFDVEPTPLPLHLYPDVYIGERARAFIETRPAGAPWFCWTGFVGPHPPWDPPAPYAARFNAIPTGSVKPRLEDKFRRPAGQIDALPAQHFPITEDKVIRIRRAYAAKLALIDDQIGALVKAIADRGDLDTTLIVLTSDHGEFAGDYGLMYKSAFMDSAVRIPLLVCAPSFPSTHGSHSSAHIELMDVGAFLAGAANPDASPHGHARSFAPCIEKGDPSHRSFSVSELKGELMYFDDDWKLAVNVDAQPYLLFDRRRDPSEGENLAGDPKLANVRRDLTVKLLRHLLLTRTIPAQG